jgi:GT2 family glycosyltransferase
VSQRPTCSLIVVNHNGGDFVGRAVESALAQSYPEHEVVLVDNASTDGSLARITESPAFSTSPVRRQVLRLARNAGCGGGRNAGMRVANGELLAFLDADAVAPPDWLQAVSDELADSDRVGIVASTSLSMRNPRLMQSQGGVLTLGGHAIDLGCGEPWEFTRLDEEPIYAMGNGLVVRRRVVEEIGEFDESFRNYYEDVDFCLRARLAGYRVRPCRRAPLMHFGGHSDQAFGDKPILLERHRIRMVLKTYRGRMLRQWLVHELGEWLRGGKGVSRRTRLGAWIWNAARLPSLVARRQRFRLRAQEELAGLRPSWSLPRALDYNLKCVPEPLDLERGIRLGDEPVKAIAHGFHWREDGRGETYRWTDGLGCLLVRAGRAIDKLRLRLDFTMGAESHGSPCLLALVDRERDLCFAGWIEPAGAGWHDYDVAVGAPGGTYELFLVSARTSIEASQWNRRLGLAVASVRAA